MLYISVMLTYGIGEYTGVKIGSTAADLVVPVLLYISVLVIAIGKNSLTSIGIKNWHLVEGYLFLIAMVVAPPSIIEVILASKPTPLEGSPSSKNPTTLRGPH